MGDHSDSDSSPKSSSSSSSPSARRCSSPRRGQAHSDESGSSDGVLVELPAQVWREADSVPMHGPGLGTNGFLEELLSLCRKRGAPGRTRTAASS